MDVREPRAPTFTTKHDFARLPVFPSPLAEKVDTLERRIAVLEEKLKDLVPTLFEATATLLKLGPDIIFTVPIDVDLMNGLHSRLAAELKEDLGVRKVIFAHKGVETSVLSSKE